MEIENFTIKNKVVRNNIPYIPGDFRGLIVGPSACGKSVVLFNLLLKDGWLDYNHLLVFGNSLHQKEYRIIREGFEKHLNKSELLNLFRNQDFMDPFEVLENLPSGGLRSKPEITAEFYEDCSKIPDPKELDPRLKNLLILDDCFLGPQSKARAYWSRGRHSSTNCVFISQNYFALDRRSIRENSNFIILYRQNSKSVHHIYEDHCTDLPFDEFKRLCERIWSEEYGFLVIDLTSDILDGKYREGFSRFYLPNEFH